MLFGGSSEKLLREVDDAQSTLEQREQDGDRCTGRVYPR
jgi:hypothetical protein